MNKKVFNKLTKTVLNEFVLDKALANILIFYNNDNRFCYSGTIKTPDEIANQLKALGLKTELFNLKSDGKASYLDCIMPRLWEIKDAGLEIVAPVKFKRIISDYAKSKFIVANGCRETKRSGVTGEIIQDRELGAKSAKGKFVLTFEDPMKIKTAAIKQKAAAIISASSGAQNKDKESIQWLNGGTVSAGWYPTKDEPGIAIFTVSYNEGKRLERLMKKGKPVILKGFVDAKTFDGNRKAVSALIPGKSGQELLLIGHMYEPFYSDNCDGNAAMLEIARILTKLIKEKKIPKPARSLRLLFSHERYGSSHYFTDKKRSDRIFAAVNIDSLSTDRNFSERPLKKYLSPAANPSFIDLVLEDAAEKHLSGIKIKNKRGSYSDDTFMADPSIGIPSCWILADCGSKHHNSKLTFDTCDWKLYTRICKTLTAFALELLYLDDRLAADRVPAYVKAAKSLSISAYTHLLKRSKGLSIGRLAANYDFTAHWNRDRFKSLEKLGISRKTTEKGVKDIFLFDRKEKIRGLLKTKVASDREFRPELFELEKITPLRLTRGMPFSLAKIPYKKRVPLPGKMESFISWMDGKRTLKDCIELLEMETLQELSREALERLLNYTAYLAEWKYLKLNIS